MRWGSVAAGVLTLIALQVLGSGQGPEQGGKLLLWVAGGLDRLFSPDVPGIPRVGQQPGAAKPSQSQPSQPARPTEIANGLPAYPQLQQL